MNRRRLDFEQLRDSLLVTGGALDPALYGQPVEGIEKSRRRTIYTFIDRQSMPGLLRAFDFPDPNQHAPQRSSTTVPQQSLYLLNNPFVQEMAHSLAIRPDVMGLLTDRARAARMIAIAYGRPAQSAEVDLAARFLKRLAKAPLTVETAFEPHWQYGYGEIDQTTHRLLAYTPLPKFTGRAWQGGDALPDPLLGWVTLNAGGGHPGDQHHAAVRRWIAPRDMTVAIKGPVNHPAPNGNGVLAVVCVNENNVVAASVVAHATVDVTVPSVALRKGDRLDFIIELAPRQHQRQLLLGRPRSSRSMDLALPPDLQHVGAPPTSSAGRSPIVPRR